MAYQAPGATRENGTSGRGCGRVARCVVRCVVRACVRSVLSESRRFSGEPSAPSAKACGETFPHAPQIDIWRHVREHSGAGLRMRCGQLTPPISDALAPGLSGARNTPAPPGERRCRSRRRRVFTHRRLGGIPPSPPARKSACPCARRSRPPLTPRAAPRGRLRDSQPPLCGLWAPLLPN